MNKVIGIICLIALMFSGCASMYPVGILYTEVQIPNNMATDGDVAYTKVGIAKATSVLGLVALGDASQRAAIRDGKITRVKYVDYAAKNILGLYGEYTTTVYGD